MKQPSHFVFILIIIFVFSLNISSLKAQTSEKIQNYYINYKGKTKPRLTLLTIHQLPNASKWAIETYFYVSQAWAQGLVGLSYTHNNWLTVGFQGGMQHESGEELWRLSSYLFMTKNNFSFVGIYEWGGNLDYAIVRPFYTHRGHSYGACMIKFGSFLSVGPRVDFRVPKTSWFLFAAPMIVPDNGKIATMFGTYLRLRTNPCRED